MVFLVQGRGAGALEKKPSEQAEEKNWQIKSKKNEEYRENLIIATNIFGFKKIIFCLKAQFEKISLYGHILLTVFMSCRISETQ